MLNRVAERSGAISAEPVVGRLDLRKVARLQQSRLKLRRKFAHPGADRGPVPNVTCWLLACHLFKEEAQLRRIVLAAKHLECDRLEPRVLRKCLVELRARGFPFLLVVRIVNWTDYEHCHRSFHKISTMARKEVKCVLVPMEHEERRAQHDPVVLCECTNFPQGLNIYFKPTFT